TERAELVHHALEGIEDPERLARRGVEREELEPRRGAVEHGAHDDRLALDLRAVRPRVAPAVGPGHAQPRHVRGVDLVEVGVLPVAGVATVEAPVARSALGSQGSGGRGEGRGDRGRAEREGAGTKRHGAGPYNPRRGPW